MKLLPQPNADALTLNPLQLEHQRLIASPAKVIMAIGPQRTGKTVSGIDALVYRAANIPNSRHAIFRKVGKDAKDSIFNLTLKEIFQRQQPELYRVCNTPNNRWGASWNKQDLIVTLPNGSTIMVGGLDDDERLNRMMGMEYTTIYLNEVAQMDSFSIVTRCLGRLSQTCTTARSGKPVSNKLLMDCNPPAEGHWIHKLFALGLHPVTNQPLKNLGYYAHVHIGIEDNKHNLPPGYYEELQENLTGDELDSLLYGKYTKSNPYAVFKRDWIDNNKVSQAPDGLEKIVAVDPSTTETGDETGIVVLGIDRETDQAYLIADYSHKGTPQEWAKTVSKAYQDHGCGMVVAERNQGGKMVTAVLQGAYRNLPVHLTWASDGKVVRAQPVGNLYQSGKVHHVGSFEDLEDQMIRFQSSMKRTKGNSPDRVDALVWGLTYLMLGDSFQPVDATPGMAVWG